MEPYSSLLAEVFFFLPVRQTRQLLLVECKMTEYSTLKATELHAPALLDGAYSTLKVDILLLLAATFIPFRKKNTIWSPGTDAVCKRQPTMTGKYMGNDVTHRLTLGLPLLAADSAHAYTVG